MDRRNSGVYKTEKDDRAVYEGYLRKGFQKKHLVALLQGSHMRYFILNLEEMKLFQYGKDPKEETGDQRNFKVFEPKDFLRIEVISKVWGDNVKGKKKHYWQHGFRLICRSKRIELFSYSESDRLIWLKAFKHYFELIDAQNPEFKIQTDITTDEGNPFVLDDLSPTEETKRDIGRRVPEEPSSKENRKL